MQFLSLSLPFFTSSGKFLCSSLSAVNRKALKCDSGPLSFVALRSDKGPWSIDTYVVINIVITIVIILVILIMIMFKRERERERDTSSSSSSSSSVLIIYVLVHRAVVYLLSDTTPLMSSPTLSVAEVNITTRVARHSYHYPYHCARYMW